MKSIKALFVAVFAMLLVTSCGLSGNLTTNCNLNQTNVVLSQNNFQVLHSVKSEVSSTYVFGIGGISKKALKANAVAELTKKASLAGSQALVNVTVKQSGFTVFGLYTKVIYTAEGTVIEFK